MRTTPQTEVILVAAAAVAVYMMTGLAGTTVLVSGASGYVGAHVVKTLLDRGYSVRGTVRSTSNKTKIAHLQVSQRVSFYFSIAATRQADQDLSSLAGACFARFPYARSLRVAQSFGSYAPVGSFS